MTSEQYRSGETPVLVAGAGPSGLAAAAELAHHGIDCVVIEPRREISHSRPRAKTTSVRTMEHLRRWGVAGELRAAAPLSPSWSQRITFCESLMGQRTTDFDGVLGLAPSREELFAECGQQVAQPVMEDVLRRHLASRPAVDLRLGDRVVSARADGGPVTVTVRDEAGADTVLTARHVLACDGARSILRDAVGARLAGDSDARPNFNVLFRAPGLDTPLGPAVHYWVVGAPVPGLIGRLDRKGLWWAVIPGVDHDYGKAHATELITGLIGAPVDLDVLATDSWTAQMRVADSFQRDGVYLVGESAHLNPPWGGHGFNTCVGDAVNIAWKIAAVENGWAGPGILSSYEAERRPVSQSIVAAAELNMRTLPADLTADAAHIQQAKAAEFYSLGLVLGYSYARSPVVQDGPAVPSDPMAYVPNTDPGSRLPHTWMPDGSSLYDHLGPAMSLVGPASRHRQAVDTLLSRAASLGIPLAVAEPPRAYPYSGEFLLVRPDQHIAWRAAAPQDINLAIPAARQEQ